jgi:hypothetical protein
LTRFGAGSVDQILFQSHHGKLDGIQPAANGLFSGLQMDLLCQTSQQWRQPPFIDGHSEWFQYEYVVNPNTPATSYGQGRGELNNPDIWWNPNRDKSTQ